MWLWYCELSSGFFKSSVQTWFAKVRKREEINSANENRLLHSFSISHMLFPKHKAKQIRDTKSENKNKPSKLTTTDFGGKWTRALI